MSQIIWSNHTFLEYSKDCEEDMLIIGCRSDITGASQHKKGSFSLLTAVILCLVLVIIFATSNLQECLVLSYCCLLF